MITCRWLFLALCVGCQNLASSAGTIYTNRASFDAVAGPVLLETFESAPLSGTAGSGAVSSMAFPFFTITSSPAAIKVMSSAVFGAHNTTAGGANYLYLDTDMAFTGTTATFISFASPITEFGFDITDLEASSGTIEIPGQVTYTAPRGADGDERFWGFISSEPFSSISFNTGTDSGLGIDNVVIIPEPGVSLLLASVMCGALAFWQKRLPTSSNHQSKLKNPKSLSNAASSL
jgi:hypothetical protein